MNNYTINVLLVILLQKCNRMVFIYCIASSLKTEICMICFDLLLASDFHALLVSNKI